MLQPRALPGVQPVRGPWLHLDEAYAGQMAQREALLADRRDAVFWQMPEALEPAQELLDHVLDMLPALGFAVADGDVHCPDGRRVVVRRDAPLLTLGRLVQCDLCLLDRGVEGEHVLKGAVLCFPARWRLDEKAGRPLSAIHDPVKGYDTPMAARVQRLFDGVQAGRPLWRFNRL
jgi:dimethylamine monooxygenase subunit A